MVDHEFRVPVSGCRAHGAGRHYRGIVRMRSPTLLEAPVAELP